MSQRKKSAYKSPVPTRPSSPAVPAARGRARGKQRGQSGDSRRYVTLAILGVGVLIALWVLLQSFAPTSGVSQSTSPQAPDARTTEAAIATFQERLRQNPGDQAAIVGLGNAYYDAGKFAEAIPWYEKALESAPENTDVRTDMGTAYLYSGNRDKAKEQWLKVLEQDPNKIQTHYNLGILYAGSTPPDLDAAAREWEAVIRISPNSEQAKGAEKQLQTIGKR